jgi:hypothetical protein
MKQRRSDPRGTKIIFALGMKGDSTSAVTRWTNHPRVYGEDSIATDPLRVFKGSPPQTQAIRLNRPGFG